MSNLPFLKKKQSSGIAGTLTEYRKPDAEGEGHNDKDESTSEDEALRACARDIIECVQHSDEAGLAKALKAAHEICDQYLHEEGPHTNEEEE